MIASGTGQFFYYFDVLRSSAACVKSRKLYISVESTYPIGIRMRKNRRDFYVLMF